MRRPPLCEADRGTLEKSPPLSSQENSQRNSRPDAEEGPCCLQLRGKTRVFFFEEARELGRSAAFFCVSKQGGSQLRERAGPCKKSSVSQLCRAGFSMSLITKRK
uniref:Uncharacterized protein n=1 Tax=Oryzias latipes TaxID=8090 RepID=A0A286P9Q3_ORYLA|nr:hypothetical protein [Oryzias latipes]